MLRRKMASFSHVSLCCSQAIGATLFSVSSENCGFGYSEMNCVMFPAFSYTQCFTPALASIRIFSQEGMCVFTHSQLLTMLVLLLSERVWSTFGLSIFLCMQSAYLHIFWYVVFVWTGAYNVLSCVDGAAMPLQLDARPRHNIDQRAKGPRVWH